MKLGPGRFCTTIKKAFGITFNIIGKQFPSSGRFSNVSIGTWKEYVIFRNFHQGNQGELATLKWDCAFDDTSMESGKQSEYVTRKILGHR